MLHLNIIEKEHQNNFFWLLAQEINLKVNINVILLWRRVTYSAQTMKKKFPIQSRL